MTKPRWGVANAHFVNKNKFITEFDFAMYRPWHQGRYIRALIKPATAKTALKGENEATVFAYCVSGACRLRSLTSM